MISEFDTLDLSDRTPALTWRARPLQPVPYQTAAQMAEHVGERVRVVFEDRSVVTGRLATLVHPDGWARVVSFDLRGGMACGIAVRVDPLTSYMSGGPENRHGVTN